MRTMTTYGIESMKIIRFRISCLVFVSVFFLVSVMGCELYEVYGEVKYGGEGGEGVEHGGGGGGYGGGYYGYGMFELLVMMLLCKEVEIM